MWREGRSQQTSAQRITAHSVFYYLLPLIHDGSKTLHISLAEWFLKTHSATAITILRFGCQYYSPPDRHCSLGFYLMLGKWVRKRLSKVYISRKDPHFVLSLMKSRNLGENKYGELAGKCPLWVSMILDMSRKQPLSPP